LKVVSLTSLLLY